MTPLGQNILRTLLYYDIWDYPLTATELFLFLPVNSMSISEFKSRLAGETGNSDVMEHGNYYYVRGRSDAIVSLRARRERHARKMWLMAMMVMHMIKRFPFVRAVFVSGDLSKNATHPTSDVDFFIVTEPNRLWIARSLLIAFKKTFLFNRKKYFCVNSFVVSDHMRLDARNVFLASEIAHLKPLFNSSLFREYLHANDWIKGFFPNFDLRHISFPRVNEKPSIIQKILEAFLSLFPLDRIDDYLLVKMKEIWKDRYPQIEEETRERIFISTKQESRAYIGDFETKVLDQYRRRLQAFGLQ